jgi:hypothetical protein
MEASGTEVQFPENPVIGLAASDGMADAGTQAIAATAASKVASGDAADLTRHNRAFDAATRHFGARTADGPNRTMR